MSAMSFARQAFSREKPHSSITDWVDILTSTNYEEEAYDGIPELVDAINLQGAGPAEASRAIRKKLKHGNPHQQYRAMVILKALVENCGHKFQTTFADGQLTDTLKLLTSDPSTNQKVKKKVLLVIASWEHQFDSDPSMALVAGLYKQCKQSRRISQQNVERLNHTLGAPNLDRAEKEETRRKQKEAKESERRKREEERMRERERGSRSSRVPFDFEKEKPQVLTSIVNASQASSNLINAITLVNRETDSLQSNERVQECLTKAKQARRPVVRYIQLVENEELIGTLIETNERIITAMEMYDQLSTANPQSNADYTSAVSAGLAAAHISVPESEVIKLQEKQRAAVERAKQNGDTRAKSQVIGAEDDSHIHPDLQDLNFGPLGASSNNLPAPLRPSALSDDGNGPDEGKTYDRRGSLSDFSDYESSDEEAHKTAATSSSRRGRRDYVDVSDDPDDDAVVGVRGTKVGSHPGKGALVNDDDPFADPFADEVAIGPSKKW